MRLIVSDMKNAEEKPGEPKLTGLDLFKNNEINIDNHSPARLCNAKVPGDWLSDSNHIRILEMAELLPEEMNLEKDKLGQSLLKKNIISEDTLKRALRLKEQEDTTKKRSLAQILVSDFNIDHDSVFSEVADLYGFKKISLVHENINKG